MINIELFGQLAIDKPRQIVMEFLPPVTVREIAQKIGTDIEKVGLITIDGCQVDFDNVIQSRLPPLFLPLYVWWIKRKNRMQIKSVLEVINRITQ